MGIACAFDVVLVKQRLGSARCEYLGLSENVAPPRVLEQLSYHLMHLVLYVEGPYHENQLVLTQSVRECPLQLLGNSVQRLVSTTPVGAIAMYTANLNSLAPETLKKCSCLLSYDFLLVRYAKMCILMETSNKATHCQCYCHSHIRIGFLGAKKPRKVFFCYSMTICWQEM